MCSWANLIDNIFGCNNNCTITIQCFAPNLLPQICLTCVWSHRDALLKCCMIECMVRESVVIKLISSKNIYCELYMNIDFRKSLKGNSELSKMRIYKIIMQRTSRYHIHESLYIHIHTCEHILDVNIYLPHPTLLPATVKMALL